MSEKEQLAELKKIRELYQQLNEQVEFLTKEIELLSKGFMLLQGNLGLLSEYPEKIVIRYVT